MRNISRRKNGGTILIEPLENSYEDLNDGDQYVYLGKHNRVLNKGSERTDDNRIGRVIWVYNVKDINKVVMPFDAMDYIEYKKYLVMFKEFLNKQKTSETYHRGVITIRVPSQAKEYMEESALIREHIKNNP
jgi:hypothetical protein